MSRDSVSTTDGYIGLTERIQRIANKTPDRFKRNPVNDENRRPVEIGRKRPTLVSLIQFYDKTNNIIFYVCYLFSNSYNNS